MKFFSLVFKQLRTKKERRSKTPALFGNPMKRALCLRVFTLSPKKPNSADRQVAQGNVNQYHKGDLKLTERRQVNVFLPGILHSIVKHSTFCIRGGRARDLPGVRYKAVRGLLDFEGIDARRQGRSKYGTKLDWKKEKKRKKKFKL